MKLHFLSFSKIFHTNKILARHKKNIEVVRNAEGLFLPSSECEWGDSHLNCASNAL